MSKKLGLAEYDLIDILEVGLINADQLQALIKLSEGRKPRTAWYKRIIWRKS